MRYARQPQNDRRFARGDDFAGDAWQDTQTGEVTYTVVGHDPNVKAYRRDRSDGAVVEVSTEYALNRISHYYRDARNIWRDFGHQAPARTPFADYWFEDVDAGEAAE